MDDPFIQESRTWAISKVLHGSAQSWRPVDDGADLQVDGRWFAVVSRPVNAPFSLVPVESIR